MAVGIHELRALTPLGMPFKIQRLGYVVLQVSNLVGQDTNITRSENYHVGKDTTRVYGDTTKRPARGRR